LTSLKVLNPNERSQLFSNIRDIRNLNELVLAEMQSQQKPIGEIFSFYTDYFKIYATYCADQPQALLLLQKLDKKNIAFRNHCVEARVSDEESSLFSLLLSFSPSLFLSFSPSLLIFSIAFYFVAKSTFSKSWFGFIFDE
jgi:hypothetical protein